MMHPYNQLYIADKVNLVLLKYIGGEAGQLGTCIHTVLWEMFVVKIFSWGRRTTKIRRTNICVQYTLHVFNYRGLPRTTKIFKHENFMHENSSHKISPNCGVYIRYTSSVS